MQTSLTGQLLQSASGREADAILRNCVHCGFCNATCPTYQLTGDELDGPRGRIYLIKQVLEGHSPSARTQLHLDRCLTCRACETTCPSGVDYHRLLDTGRALTDQAVRRPAGERLLRLVLRRVLTCRPCFTLLLRSGQWLRPLLPAALRARIPARQRTGKQRTGPRHERSVLLLAGCVQPALAPQINHATGQVLDALGIDVVHAKGEQCCGALSHHLGATEEARQLMRRNIDAWWPHIEAGAGAILITASGCAPQVKDYGRLLADDSRYAHKAARVGELARDISEYLAAQRPLRIPGRAADTRVAFHAPCSLQHGQRITGVVETMLEELGYTLTRVAEGHLCCGSAGTYSILQGRLATQLRERKLAALQADHPDFIATANIGCHAHLAGPAGVPVLHWIELLARLLPDRSS